jgi:hypothetical protein
VDFTRIRVRILAQIEDGPRARRRAGHVTAHVESVLDERVILLFPGQAVEQQHDGDDPAGATDEQAAQELTGLDRHE